MYSLTPTTDLLILSFRTKIKSKKNPLSTGSESDLSERTTTLRNLFGLTSAWTVFGSESTDCPTC